MTKTVTITTACVTTTIAYPSTGVSVPTSCQEFSAPAVGTIAGMFFVGMIFGIVFGAVIVKQSGKRKRENAGPSLEKEKDKGPENGRIKENGGNGVWLAK